MCAGNNDQVDTAVQSPIKSEIGLLGVNGIIDAIVHRDYQLVLLPQMPRQVNPEGGISALMFPYHLSIQFYLCRHGCPLDF